jgi:hypothetical protein
MGCRRQLLSREPMTDIFVTEPALTQCDRKVVKGLAGP